MNTLIWTFIIGLISGTGITLAAVMTYGFFLAKKQRKLETALKKELAGIAAKREDEEKKNQYVLSKIDMAKQIIAAQNKLTSMELSLSPEQLDRAHEEYLYLEDQKNKVFQEILATGIDPLLNVYDPSNGQFSEMKLSEVVAKSMASMGTNHSKYPPEAATSQKLPESSGNVSISKKTNKDGKTFYLITKNDDGNVVN